MKFHFRPLKAIQASGLLLRLDGDAMERMRLLKLLYIADRELLSESGRPLTGDQPVAMKFGPVLSRIYDLIKGSETSEDWCRHFRSDGYKVVLVLEPGIGDLTKREIEKLHQVTERYRSVSTSALSKKTHGFSEWTKNYEPGTSKPIEWRDVLGATGKLADAPSIERRIAEEQELDAILGNRL